MGKQKNGFAWVLLGAWIVLTVLMAVWAARPSHFADIQPTADFEYPWLGLVVLSLALAMLFLNEHALFTGRLSMQRPILAVFMFSLIPLLMANLLSVNKIYHKKYSWKLIYIVSGSIFIFITARS